MPFIHSVRYFVAWAQSRCTTPTNDVQKKSGTGVGFESKEMIYDYRTNKSEYVKKCSHIVAKMMDARLVQDFNKLYDNDDAVAFSKKRNLLEEDFTERDLSQIIYAKPIIRSILNTGYEYVLFESDRDMDMLAKLIMKKYIINDKPTDRKVSVRILIGESKELKVVCYNNHTLMDKQDASTIKYKFTSPKGSIERDETVENAVIREMKEELGFTFDISRYELQTSGKKWVNYKLQLTEKEWSDYLYTLKTSELDPEITHIVLETRTFKPLLGSEDFFKFEPKFECIDL